MPTVLAARRPDGTPDLDVLDRAARALASGRLVAMPTETVYGLAANALDPDAVARIYAAKGRPAFNPLIVHVPDLARARALAVDWPPLADRLAAAFWPGPLTLVVRRSARIPAIVTGGHPSVGLRVPGSEIARLLLERAGLPLAAPSANRFMHVSPSRAEHVVASLGDAVELVLDDGPCAVGIESSVVDLTSDPPRLLRPGGVSLDQLRDVEGAFTAGAATHEAAHPPSPGLLARHYAPDAETELLAPADLRNLLDSLRNSADRRRLGLVLRTVDASLAPPATVTQQLPPDPAGYARNLYAALHAMEASGVERLVIEAPPDERAWSAIHDRLAHATGKA